MVWFVRKRNISSNCFVSLIGTPWTFTFRTVLMTLFSSTVLTLWYNTPLITPCIFFTALSISRLVFTFLSMQRLMAFPLWAWWIFQLYFPLVFQLQALFFLSGHAFGHVQHNWACLLNGSLHDDCYVFFPFSTCLGFQPLLIFYWLFVYILMFLTIVTNSIGIPHLSICFAVTITYHISVLKSMLFNRSAP